MTTPKPTKPQYSPYPHPAALPDDALLDQCTIAASRSGGPGGQHRNKVSTEITITHTPTGLNATAGERRSQRDNLWVALRRLRLTLAVEHREPVPSGMIGSALWQSRRRRPRRADQPKVQEDPFLTEVLGVKRLNTEEPGYRIEVSPTHADLPALIAECMDTLAAMGWDPARAAIRLEVSASQLVKLLKKHSPALGLVNDERVRRGLHTLK